MVDIIHCGPVDARVIPGESHRLDQVDHGAKARAEARTAPTLPAISGW